MRDQIIDSSPKVTINSPQGTPQIEPLIVGNANGIIRFLGVLAVVLICLASYAFNKIGILEEKVAFLEDIVINGTYEISSEKEINNGARK